MRKFIIANVISIFIFGGCFNVTSKDNILPQEVVIMNMLEYDVLYDCNGVFTEDIKNLEAKGTNVIKNGKIGKNEVISLGYVLASKSHGFAVDELSIYKDFEKKNCIYKTIAFEPNKIITTINKQGLIIDEKLITEFSSK